jgi:REP element-mobilizing transposase RayT
MKKYKIYSETTSFYFCTSTIVEWQCVFKTEKYAQVIIDSLNYCRKEKGLLLFGLVIMLNHIHYMVSNREGCDLSGIIRDFKRYTSTQITKLLEEDNERLFLHIFRKAGEGQGTKIKIWRDEYHPVAIMSEKWFYEKMAYMHNNPVRKGFVLSPEGWKYSSARNWILDKHDVISLDLDRL